jgi:hypothetical protein
MTPDRDTLIAQHLRTQRIIVFALVQGIVILFAVALFIVQVQNQGRGLAGDNLVILSYLAAGMMVVAVVLSTLVPGWMVQMNLRSIARGPASADDTSKLLSLRQSSQIVGMAILEGVAQFAAIAYMLNGQVWSLAIPLFAVGLMLANFPTEYRLRGWLQDQEDRLIGLRQEVQ